MKIESRRKSTAPLNLRCRAISASPVRKSCFRPLAERRQMILHLGKTTAVDGEANEFVAQKFGMRRLDVTVVVMPVGFSWMTIPHTVPKHGNCEPSCHPTTTRN